MKKLMSVFSVACLYLVLLVVAGCGDSDSPIIAADRTPNSFSFIDQSGVAVSTVMTSNPITVTGINRAVAISILNGTYSIDGGPYTAADGTVRRGQAVTVRHTSSATTGTAINTTLTIGGVADIYTSITGTPVVGLFSFTDQTGVELSTLITSNTIPITVSVNPATISIAGGSYSLDGGAYTAAPGQVTVGAHLVAVQHTSDAANNTPINTTLTIGDVADIFTSTTLVAANVFYATSCAGCHSLGAVDPVAGGELGPGLSDQGENVSLEFTPGVAVTHNGTLFTLTAAEIAALAAYFEAN